MKKLIGTIVIGFLILNVIRVVRGNEILTAQSYLEVTQKYFELNDIGEPINSSFNQITIMQTFANAFDTEIIFESDNIILGFFNYFTQALGGIADIIKFGISWMWNITVGWITKLLAYILTLFGFGKY